MSIPKSHAPHLWVVIVVLTLSGCSLIPGQTPAATQPFVITITRAPTPLATFAILKGKVTVGPLTPVVRVDQPTPTPAPAVFTTRAIHIINDETQALVQKVNFKPDGTYYVELPPGRYRIELVKNGMDRARELPKVIVLERGQAITLDIDIDTGIR